MKFAIISDVHSNIHALRAVMAEIEKKAVDFIVCAGDLVGYGAHPAECVKTVKNACKFVIAGNHDVACATGDFSGMNPLAAKACSWTRSVLSADLLQYLASLPRALMFDNVLMVHGSPRDSNEYVYPETLSADLVEGCDCDILIMGHTHVPFIKVINKVVVLNPGSVGQPRDGNKLASYALVSGSEIKIMRVAYNIDAAYHDIIEAGLPQELGARLYLGI